MTHQDVRNYMTRADLEAVGATVVCAVHNGKTVGYVDNETLAEPGFYFMVKGSLPWRQVAARFFVGRQRSKSGFGNVLSQIRQGRSQLGRTLSSNGNVYDVYFVPPQKMKPLTTGFGKGQLSLMFTSKHKDEYQNFSEMNRMLNDNFKFILQSY
jgi:hypothetical protein